jgi:LysR family cys regulon transcriptional activator
MKLQQLRYLVEVARQGLNVSEAAEKLHTSQPGISKQVRLLEDELGVQVFIRNGKRVVAVSPPGKEILKVAERILREAANLKRIGDEYLNEANGNLTIATTHTQARYALPKVVQQFSRQYPNVRLSLKQGSPTQICELVLSGEADFAIATEGIDQYPELAVLPCYDWNRCIIVPADHALAVYAENPSQLSIEKLAEFPIITYDFAFTGRSKINSAFEAKALSPNVVLTAIDTDVIKTYVSLNLGVGIIASMAFEPERDIGLVKIDASHLFEASTTRIGLNRDAYLRGYAYAFMQIFVPALTREAITKVLQPQTAAEVEAD